MGLSVPRHVRILVSPARVRNQACQDLGSGAKYSPNIAKTKPLSREGSNCSVSYVQVAPLREARDLPKDSRSSHIQHRKQSWRKLDSFTLRKNFHLRVLESKIWTLLASMRYCLETTNPLILSAMHSSTHFLGVWLGLSLFVSNTLVGATEVCRKCSDPHRFDYPGVGFDLTMDYG